MAGAMGTFEFKPDAGIKYSKITGLTHDLAMGLKAEAVCER